MQRLLTVLTNKVIDQTVNYAYYKTLYPSGINNVLACKSDVDILGQRTLFCIVNVIF